MFSSFVDHCNSNKLRLFLTHVFDSDKLIFLDLVLSHDQNVITTSNHIKPTGGNSYLHFESCHLGKQRFPMASFID